MQFKVTVLFALMAIVVCENPKKSASQSSNKSQGDPQKNKRGLIEFGYGYDIDHSGVDFGQYVYPSLSYTDLQSVISSPVAVPTIQTLQQAPVKEFESFYALPTAQSNIQQASNQYEPVFATKQVQTPFITTINGLRYPGIEAPKLVPILIRLPQPYPLSYTKQQLQPQVSQAYGAPPPPPSPPTASPSVTHEKFSKIDKYNMCSE